MISFVVVGMVLAAEFWRGKSHLATMRADREDRRVARL